jgi:hypothetical protein
MTGYIQPISPGPVFMSLVDQCLADIKDYCINHTEILQHARLTAYPSRLPVI